MKTELQIKGRIEEKKKDLGFLKESILDENPTINKVLKSASISAAEKQLQLLEWVLN